MKFTFASPEWLWCLLLLLPLAFLRFWSQIRGVKGAPGLVSPRLTSELIVGAAQWKRWVIFGIQLWALALLLIALARPQWGYEEAEIESEGRNVFLAIDTSRSMLARDLLPDRLTRAKLAAQDIVEALPADRIGLIAFAGKAYLQAPLTVDHDAVLETVRQFDTELVPRGGTNLASAVSLAIETLEKAESEESALILFSDGENLEGEDELKPLRERAEKIGLVLVAIGVGTEPGELIPEIDSKGRFKPGEFVQDDDDNVVRSRLDPAALQDLSRQIGGGVYVNLGATASVSEVVAEAIEQIETVRKSGDPRRRPIERFMWPLTASVVFLLISWLMPGTLRLLTRLFVPASRKKPTPRRAPSPRPRKRTGAPAMPVVLAVIWALSAADSTAQDTNPRKSAGFAALNRNSYDSAIAAYERELTKEDLKGEDSAWLNLGLGTAAYKSGDFEKAKLAFGKALEYRAGNQLESKAHYNLGNALFRSGEKTLDDFKTQNPDLPQLDDAAMKEQIAGQWRGAIEHFETALKIDSGNERSRHNLSVVQKRLEILLQEPPEEEEKEEEEEEEEEDEEQDEENQEKNEDQEQPENQDPNQSPPEESNEDPQKPEDSEDSGDQGDQDQDSQPDESEKPPKKPPGKPGKPNEQPPEEPDQDGKLDANPDQPDSRPPEQPAKPQEVNPETGFSPEEARQKLRTLSDEDLEVRPAQRVPIRAERFKNW